MHGNSLCTDASGYNDQSGWAMIADPTSQYHYAQSGFLRNDTLGYRAFAESNSGTGGGTILDTTTVSAGGTYHFWEQYVVSCGCIRMNIGSHVIAQTAFNPYLAWNYPFEPQFFNEVQYPQDNQAGSVTYPVVYTSHQYQRVSDDGWETSGCTMLTDNQDPTHWAITKVGCTDFNVYTSNPRT